MSVDSITKQKSIAFARRIVRMYKYLCSEHKEFVISKQVLRSGTSIGANIAEAVFGSSRKDFVSKLQIARKEAAETCYWLELLFDSEYIDKKMFHSMHQDCEELIAILSATIKSITLQ